MGSTLLSVDCWVDITGLDEGNAIQEVCRRGFHVTDAAAGLEFTTGNIPFDAEAAGACRGDCCGGRWEGKGRCMHSPLTG